MIFRALIWREIKYTVNSINRKNQLRGKSRIYEAIVYLNFSNDTDILESYFALCLRTEILDRQYCEKWHFNGCNTVVYVYAFCVFKLFRE